MNRLIAIYMLGATEDRQRSAPLDRPAKDATPIDASDDGVGVTFADGSGVPGRRRAQDT